MQNSTKKMKKIGNSIIQSRKKVDDFWLEVEIEERCKGVHCVDLGESFPNSNEYLLAKIGVDTAENEPLEVWGKIQFNIQSCPYSQLFHVAACDTLGF